MALRGHCAGSVGEACSRAMLAAVGPAGCGPGLSYRRRDDSSQTYATAPCNRYRTCQPSRVRTPKDTPGAAARDTYRAGAPTAPPSAILVASRPRQHSQASAHNRAVGFATGKLLSPWPTGCAAGDHSTPWLVDLCDPDVPVRPLRLPPPVEGGRAAAYAWGSSTIFRQPPPLEAAVGSRPVALAVGRRDDFAIGVTILTPRTNPAA